MKLPSRIWQLILASLVLVALQLLVFSPALDNTFLKYDDDVYVYNNANIQTLKAANVAWMFARPYYRSYTPLTLLSHAVDYRMWGNNPWGHHLTSLLLHCVNAVLVFLLGLMLLHAGRPTLGGKAQEAPGSSMLFADTASIVGAVAASLFFSLHPMRVESVAWISDRKDLLVALFTLLCCIAYLQYDTCRSSKRALRWYLGSLIFFALALFSKSIAVVIPVVLIFLDMLLLHRRDSRNKWTSLVAEKIPFLMLSVAFGVFAIIAAKESQLSDIVAKLSPAQRVLLPFYSIMFYPVKMLWPSHLTPVYDAPGILLMAIAAILCIGITVFAIISARRGREGWLLAWLCYVVAIVPTITGLSAGIQPWADRYSYLPTISLMLLLGWGIRSVWERRGGVVVQGLVAASCVVLVSMCMRLSAQQLPVWTNAEVLWRYAIGVTPEVPMPYANLGVALEGKGDHDGALKMYKKAVALEPHYADALYNMGISYEAKQLVDSAASSYAKAIAADRTYSDAYVNLGNIYVRGGKLDDGISLFEQAIQLDGSDPDPYYNMGIAVYYKGDRVKALECFQAAVKYSPSYANAYHNMGIVFVDMGNSDAAMESFLRAARLGSADAQKLLRSKGFSW
jgi:protein O-mannosyl-transferase